jgi:hypothetical protein
MALSDRIERSCAGSSGSKNLGSWVAPIAPGCLGPGEHPKENRRKKRCAILSHSVTKHLRPTFATRIRRTKDPDVNNTRDLGEAETSDQGDKLQKGPVRKFAATGPSLVRQLGIIPIPFKNSLTSLELRSYNPRISAFRH